MSHSFTRDIGIARAMRKATQHEIFLPSLAEEFLKAALDERNHEHAAAMVTAIQTQWPEETVSILGSVRSDILNTRKNLPYEKQINGFTVPHMNAQADFCAAQILEIANSTFIETRINALADHEEGRKKLPRVTQIKYINGLESAVGRFWDIVQSNDDEEYKAPPKQAQAPMQRLYDMAPALAWFVERGYGCGAVDTVRDHCSDEVLKAKAALRVHFLEASIADWERNDKKEPMQTPQSKAATYREFLAFAPV